MDQWSYSPSDKYLRQVKQYGKKRRDELAAVSENLVKYVRALNLLGGPQFINGKFVHREPMGIKALDESGERKVKNLQPTRLYVYPDGESKTLYLLLLNAKGNRQQQQQDIELCKDMVKQIRGPK